MTLKISKELKELEKFLYSDAVSEDAMLLSELDGFIAGIAICPALIMPSEWIPVIWADEEPVFENEEQAQNIMSILMATIMIPFMRWTKVNTGPFMTGTMMAALSGKSGWRGFSEPFICGRMTGCLLPIMIIGTFKGLSLFSNKANRISGHI